MFWDDDFMDYICYRDSVMEDKINECLDAARRGDALSTITTDDLTDSELEHVRSEVSHRLRNGLY